MSDAAGPSQLADYAEVLIQQIRNHADILAASRRPDDVIPAVNSLRTAAGTYVQAVFNETGWGDVFADLQKEEEDEGDPGVPEKADAQPPLVSYRAEYRFRIHDFEAARHLLRQRSRAHQELVCDDFDDSYSGVIAGLAQLEGWKPYSYDQQVIEVVSARWDSHVETERPVGSANRKKARAARRGRRRTAGSAEGPGRGGRNQGSGEAGTA